MLYRQLMISMLIYDEWSEKLTDCINLSVNQSRLSITGWKQFVHLLFRARYSVYLR